MTRREEKTRRPQTATFTGLCDRCGRVINQGDPIATRGRHWMHQSCAGEDRE